jgi:hypothetical protein
MPFGASPRRSGSANVEIPLPPYVVPRSENIATFSTIDRICPFAGVPPAATVGEAPNRIWPSVHVVPSLASAVFVFWPNFAM